MRVDPRFASPEARAALLLEHRAGASIRALSTTYGRAKSAVALDLKQAREEEAAAEARARAEAPPPAPAADPKPETPKQVVGILVAGADGVRGRTGSTAPRFTLPRPRFSEGVQGAMERNEIDNLLAHAIRKAGMEPRPGTRGTVPFTTPGGTRTSYEPSDADDVARVRRLIRDEVYRNRLTALGIPPIPAAPRDTPARYLIDADTAHAHALAEDAAREAAAQWIPHGGLR